MLLLSKKKTEYYFRWEEPDFIKFMEKGIRKWQWSITIRIMLKSECYDLQMDKHLDIIRMKGKKRNEFKKSSNNL